MRDQRFQHTNQQPGHIWTQTADRKPSGRGVFDQCMRERPLDTAVRQNVRHGLLLPWMRIQLRGCSLLNALIDGTHLVFGEIAVVGLEGQRVSQALFARRYGFSLV